MSSPSIENIKQSIELLDVASYYCELQKQNGNYKAKVNPLREEKTSSLIFYADSQKWHDFGSGESGDCFDFIQKMERCTLHEAKEKALSLIGKEPLHVSTPKPKCEVVIIDSQALQAEFNRFEKVTLRNNLHKEEVLKVVPHWLIKEADKEDLALFQSIIRYDAYHHTLVAGWYKNSDTAFDMVTYKHRRKGEGKWINRIGTHPNSVAFHRIMDNGKVYVIEGAHDALTAILLGISFIALPTTSYSNVEQFKSLLRDGDEVVYIVEDKQGFECMKKLHSHTGGKLIALSKDKDKKMDLSDFTLTQQSIKEVLNGL